MNDIFKGLFIPSQFELLVVDDTGAITPGDLRLQSILDAISTKQPRTSEIRSCMKWYISTLTNEELQNLAITVQSSETSI